MKSGPTKRLQCAYLYADGHAILIYEKQDRDAGRIEFAEVHERFTDAKILFQGRLVFNRFHAEGLLRLAKLADEICATRAKIESGSDRTKELGIAVGSLRFHIGGDVSFHSMPDILSDGWTYQPDMLEHFDEGLSRWGHSPVARIHRVKTGGGR